MIEQEYSDLSVVKQCEILGLARSSLYYQASQYTPEEIGILNAMDEIFTECPFYGHRKVYHELKRRGHQAGRDRILRYMHALGMEPFYPKTKRTTIPNKEHKIYPYLLRDLDIIRPNQVWATDITYIRLKGGFCYLVIIMDWHSRMVLAWRLSNSLGAAFCLEAIDEALADYPVCDIFNSDQGSQFTSEDFTGRLLEKNVLISMDSKGRALDNIIPERFFRSLKYEDVYLHNYSFMQEAKEGIGRYISFYNAKRIHESLDYRTPLEIYRDLVPRENKKQEILISGVSGHLEQENLASNRILESFPKEKYAKFQRIQKDAVLVA